MPCREKIVPVILILLLFSFTFTAPFVMGETEPGDRPLIGEDDDYRKEVEVGGKTTFNWTVYKNVEENFAVRVRAEGFGDSEKRVSPDFFILDEEEKYRVVSLKVELPTVPDERVKEGEVHFSFRRLGDEDTITETKNATIDVTGLPPVGEENTIVGGFENPLPPPLDGPLGAFLLNLLIWFLIALGTFLVVTPILSKLAKRSKTDLDEVLVKMVRRPLLVFIFIYGVIHSLLRLDIPFDLRATLYQVYSLIALLIGMYVAYKILNAVLKEIAAQRGGLKSPFGSILKPIFEQIGLVIILLGGLVIGLSIIGIQVTAILAGAGVFGLVIAFAAQDTLSNFFSGMHLLLDRPFTVGDVLLLESGEYCKVEDVGMRSTKLYNIRDHEMIVLPNNSIANQMIVNVAEPDPKIRVLVNVGVAYGSDIEKVKEILYDVLGEHDDVIIDEEYEPVVRFNEFADSSLEFNVRFWVDHYLKQWEVASAIRDRIDKEFREANVTIPFPQRTVWMKEQKKEEESEKKSKKDN